jgi:cohesin complex subunit SA-1/2
VILFLGGAPLLVYCTSTTDLNSSLLLTDAVRSESAAITVAAKDWVDRFKSDRADATAEVLTFLLQACGITSHAVTAEDAEHTGADEIKQEADAIAQEEGLDELLGGRSAAARHLKASYREMWDKLIREAANAGLLRGGFFLDKATNLIIALNTSVVRELRKVATITAAQVATSLLHVVVTLQEARDTAAGQAKAEETKKASGKGGKAANDRYAAFTRQRDQATSNITELLNYVDSIFQSVFMNRFRDIDAEIRLAVVQGIGHWMQLVPATFLTSGYLKYIAWAVSDKDAHVRLEAATTLCALYSIPSNAAQLKEFTERFSARFQELMSDKEDSVAIAGVKLVTQLVRVGHFPATVGIHVVRLMSDSSSGLRAAAADLAAGMLMDLGKEALVAAAKRTGGGAGGAGTSKAAGGRKGGRSKTNTANATGNQHSEQECELAGVLRVLRMLAAEDAGLTGPSAEVDAPALGEGVIALVVGSLATRASALRNWQLMVEWLKNDTAVDVFGDEATSDLLYCLLSGLRCAAGSSGALIAPVRGAARDKQATARAKARQEATLALRDELQSLLTKFQAEPAQVATAIALIPELKLEVFSLRAEEKKLSSLLGVVKNIFFKHAEISCLEACVDALVTCARSGPDTTKDAARAVLSEVVSTTVAEVNKAATQLENTGNRTLSAATAAYRESNGEKESAALFAARAATRRAQALCEVYAEGFATDPSGQEGLGRILELAAAGADMPAEVLGCTGTSALITLMYTLKSLGGEGESPDLAALGQLSAAQATLASQLEAISNEAEKRGKPARDVSRAIAAVQADFMTVFSGEILPETLKEAAYRPSDTAVNALWKGLEAMLFVPGEGDNDSGENDDDDEENTLPGFEKLSKPAEIIARLAATGAVPQYRQLAAQLLSYWESANAPSVGIVAKEVVRRLKTVDPSHLPSIYLAAMQASYLRYKTAADAAFDSGEYTTEELAEHEEELLQPFLDLSAKIAASQAGFNAPATTLAFIAEEGAKWALTHAPPQSIDFLQGASYFMVRVKGSAAAKVLATVEAAGAAAGAPERPDEEDEEEAQAWGEWDLYYQYCDALRDQAVKPTGGAKSRKPAGGAAAANAAGGGSGGKKGGAKAGGRRISFAPGAGGDESDEEEEEEFEEEEEVQPAPRSLGGKKKTPTAAAAATKGKKKNTRAAKPVKLSDSEEEEEEEVEEQEEQEEVEEEGEDFSDPEDEVDVMPTEEQLPGMRGGARASGGSRGRVTSQQAIEASESESESESEDEEDEKPAFAARRQRNR